MLLLYLSLILSVSFYHGCNAEVSVTIGNKNITNGEAVQVSAGSDLMVTCISDNKNDTVSLVSNNNAINITVYNGTMMHSVEYSVNHVMKNDHNSVVTCKDGRNNTLSFNLDVTYVPEIIFSQTNYSGMEGNSLSIWINISANPPVDSVHWYMNGVGVNDTDVMTSNDNITFDTLDRMNGGHYSVYGVNSEGTGPMATFLLTVYYDIEFSVSVNESTMLMVTLDEGDTYTINCSLSSVGSNPPITTVHIQQSNGSIINNRSIDITAKGDTYYLCVANNGMDTVHFNYTITVTPATTTTSSSTPTTTPTTTPTPTPTQGAGYTVTVSIGLVIIAIVLSFFIN